MTSSVTKANLRKAGLAAAILLAASGAAVADTAVTLTASPTSTTLPDGQTVPMWGLFCGTVTAGTLTYQAGSDTTNAGATPCTTMTGAAQAGGWQPPLIRVPAGQALQITLKNNLSFTTGTGSNAVPTSLVIVGQIGGGLGDVTQRTTMPSPTRAPQGTTWPGTLGGTGPDDAVFNPPKQVDRVRSFATEVSVSDSAGKVLTWNNLRPGTYLIESGTQPSIQGPMGLYGVVVVTEPDTTGDTPAHQAYGTTFDQDLALLLSEIDPAQNAAVDTAVRTAGFSDALVWKATPGACGDATVHTCYPPAVNYSPLYYLINGVSFDHTSAATSVAAVPPAGGQGRVLLRLVNAGLRMHVPAVVGASLTLLAEDANRLPGRARVQNEVFLAAGKTYDVTIQPVQTTAGTYDAATYPVFDRALGLSTGNQRDGGMQAYIQVAGGAATGVGAAASVAALSASDKTYYCIAGSTLAITDPARGLLAGASGANGAVLGALALGPSDVLDLRSNGTFTYTPAPGPSCGGTFTFLVNGTQPHTATIAQCDANSTTAAGCTLSGAPVVGDIQFTSNVAAHFTSPPPGVLAGVTANPGGLALTAVAGPGLNADGSLAVTGPGSACPVLSPAAPAGATCVQVPYQVKNTEGTLSNTANATVIFLPASGLTVHVKDAKNGRAIDDYRWIIEEDKTLWIDPKCQVNSTGTRLDSQGNACPALPVQSLGYNFHTAHLDVVAQGCVGATSCETGQTVQGEDATCDIGNGACRATADASGLGVTVDPLAGQKTEVRPSAVHLDPHKRYFISILPGDGVNATIGGSTGPMPVDPDNPDGAQRPFDIAKDCGDFDPSQAKWAPGGPDSMCGHAMGGAQLAPGQSVVDVSLQETPLPTAKIAVFVFQDDNPLNGENDAGGGVDVIAPNEPGLGGFEIKLFDQAGGLGDATGQITYDQFNEPVSNALAGKIDPITGLDSCPITARGDGLIGMIPTCPKYESDGKTPSPLAGQAVIANLYAGLYEVVATPAADRIAKGEEWLQTNTLDGGKPHEAFIKPNEPGYFQEFGPGGFHVSIGFANPAIINARKAAYCAGQDCSHTLTVNVANNHMSRTPDQRTFSSETYDHFAWTNCYVAIGPADGEDFAFQKCDPDGKATFTGLPNGTFKMTVFDQWNDIMLDGLVGTVEVSGDSTKDFPVTQWRTNLATRTFIDVNGDGVSQEDEPGLALVNTNIHYRDGSIGFFNNTDLDGYAGFNEVFPFMNWLVVETSSTRYKPTGVHTVYDAGGPVDCSAPSGFAPTPPCRANGLAAHIASTAQSNPLPAALRVPGAVYCADADCTTDNLLNHPNGGGPAGSTGTIFPPQAWGTTQGWQGLLGQNTFIEFGVKPFDAGENGGISGMVIYASTRPFDDPALSLQLSWEPGVPRAKINLYKKDLDDNGREHLTLVDTTTSASWDDWAQGFRADGVTPNMNCPGQDPTSPFFATLKDSKQWLDPTQRALPNHSQFKCYDGWSMLNQVQPAPYDGLYKFPSVTAINPANGKPAGTNCTICVANPTGDGTQMLPAGKYVVEVVLPPGYELVKEEDKNILLGDVFVAPVTSQFAGFGNIFIMPDQAEVNAYYNPSNPGGLQLTSTNGAKPRHEGDTGSVESFWPCVGAERIVPDLNSLFPGAGQQAPFAGAKRHLCDRKEVTLEDQASVLAKFYVFSSAHIAGHFTGGITNDFASEFDPFSPQFGEKFGPPNLPVGMRDFSGNEVARVYSDQWGAYNGVFFSSYSVNPPNPTGYVPQMAIACMNDPGPIPATNALGQMINEAGAVVTDRALAKMITDPAYNPAYSNFCYETPFMPGFTAYMDTPVIPTEAFADGYNLPDTEYPDGTPAILKVVNSTSNGPWVAPSTPGTRASVTFTIGGTSSNTTDRVDSILVGTTALTSTALRCGPSVSGSISVNCTSGSGTTRNNNMATAVRNNINNNRLSGLTHGYQASGTGSTVTITAPTGTGAELNGQPLTVNVTGLNAITGLSLSGGVTASLGTANMNITITALGDKVVQNPNYSGPSSTTAPFNQKTITRHYGFGSGGTVALVAPDGTTSTPLTVSGPWGDTITATIPSSLSSAYNCKVQQGGAPTAKCGELVITRSDNGKQSIDAITVTVGGSAPWYVTPTGVTPPTGKSVQDYGPNFGRMNASPLQVALDSAAPGDLILVGPGTYRENLIMWKPVRLQGVGAAAVTINADAHPAGKMDQWRRQVNCAFGLNLDGTPNLNDSSYDPTGTYSCPAAMHQRVDRIPFEAIVGWDASGNGNLAQVLQEPTLMGAYEGAGITVLGRGVRIPAGSTDFWGQQATGGAGAFTDGSVWLTNGTADCATNPAQVDGRDYGTANYLCNPSRIDGVSIANSSQGGGGIFIHGWGHNLEVGNNRIWGNHGTLAGAINLGNGETPDAFTNDGVSCGVDPAVMPCPPMGNDSLIPTGRPGRSPATDEAIPFQFNVNVRIHHNMLFDNASIGDALFSGTPAGGGALTISAGSDNYSLDHNWIAGNLSTGDGGGVQHLGLSFGGTISNNYVLFNQSTNPTLPTNGGGIVIEGANLDRILNGNECGSTNDQDCPPGLGEGTGAGLVLDSNLILGNSAESGSGGGLRIQQTNGSELVAFPTTSSRWYDVTVTNNIIANNVAGWDGGGVSLQDALKVTFVNNTVASNDTTATAGVLFKTLGAINAASPPPGCTPTTDPSLPQDPSCTGASAPHGPQPAGLVTMYHTPNLIADRPANTSCPSGYGYSNNDCRIVSKPLLKNNLFWQNRSFSVSIIGPGSGNQSQQNLVALTPLLNQTATGACAAGANYWDIGLRTDDVNGGRLSIANNKLAVTNSVYTADVQNVITTSGTNTVGGTTPVVAPYCNGARVPPENCAAEGGQVQAASCKGYNTPVGASETTSLNQLFQFNHIQPTATVDEGHNWMNLVYGPLTLGKPNVSTATNAELMVASRAYGTALGAYSLAAGSSAISRGTTTSVPATAASDFFGNPRSGHNDAGAVQFITTGALARVAPANLAFGNVTTGTNQTQTLTLTAGGAALTVPAANVVVTGSGFTRSGGTCVTSGNISLAAGASCTIVVRFAPTTPGDATGAVTFTATAGGPVTGSPVPLSGTGVKIDLTVGPALSFGDAFVGTTTAAQTVTLRNTTSPGVTVTGIMFAITGQFARATGGGAGTCPTTPIFTLGSGASCTVGIVFKPTTLNPSLGNMMVLAGAGFVVDGSPVQLTGNGLLPSVTPSSIAFGDVPVGTAVRQTLVLDNSTNVNSNSLAFPISTLTVSGTGFSRVTSGVTNNCGTSLAAGATCNIVVQFQPTATGPATGTVTVLGNAGQTIVLPASPSNLSGNGVPATYHVSVNPSPLDFGHVIVTTNTTQNLTVTNTGNSAIGGMTVTGLSGAFTRITSGSFPASAPNCGTTLAVGAACTVKVRFAPTTTGAAAATVTVGGTGSTRPQPAVPVTVQGTGDAPPVPDAPTGGNATRGGAGGQITANLSWTATLYAAGYDVMWSTSQTDINAANGTVITGASTGNSYTFNGGTNGLLANTLVYFRVRAVNSAGQSGWSSVFSSTVR